MFAGKLLVERRITPNCAATGGRLGRTLPFMSDMTAFHPTAVKLRRFYADGPQGQIHYYDSGGAGPPVLLLHQSPASSSDWFSVVPFLTEAGLRVLAMDTPGMGLSDPFPFPPALQDYADAIPVVLDHAGVSGAHLLGHHTGVQIAVDAAVRHPARVLTLSLYGAPIMSAEERDRYWREIVPRQREGDFHRPARSGTNLTPYLERVEALFGEVAAQRLLLSGLIAGPLWWHGHNAALRYDMRPAFLAATQPLLLMSHPGEMLEEHTRKAATLRPDALYISLPITGSMAMDLDPSALARPVRQFIERHHQTSATP
jgi:pimeloyl-ACP methyl ester carboxylesterase